MVRWNVRAVAESRGIKTALELAEKANINRNTAIELMGGRPERVDRKTLTRICRALQCTPGDLLIYDAGDDEKITAFGYAVAC